MGTDCQKNESTGTVHRRPIVAPARPAGKMMVVREILRVRRR
jgi:hypothetical protein